MKETSRSKETEQKHKDCTQKSEQQENAEAQAKEQNKIKEKI